MNKQKFAVFLDRFTHHFNQIMVFITAMALIFFSAQLYKLTKQSSEKLDQLTEYPLNFDTFQNVLREPPAFHLDEPVTVEARFNNLSPQKVKATAVVHWVLVDPQINDTHIDIAQFGLFLDLKPGCTHQTFVNIPPAEVTALTRQLFTEGHQKVTWQLSGNNQIIVPEGGGSEGFSVEEFSYVPNSVSTDPHQDIPDNVECKMGLE